MRRYGIIPIILAGLSAPAGAAEYLTSVTSEVYQATGTPKEIATRASTCISQHLSPGTTDSQLIISTDLDSGVIVARNALSYPDGLLQWRVRSTFTFEAREGRFRIEQTHLERFNNRWDGIGKWTGSGWKKAEAAFKASADAVAQCVIAGPKRADW
ncbi:MAG: hypothetical protein QOJ94_1003 [Sphingomonadales bacterium]|nr:hypothetical protein [Sphingomonadales bacterium]